MSTTLWKVTAKKEYSKLAKGMYVEIVISNASRPPNQKEVIKAVNEKYGEKTAFNGLSMSLFEFLKC